VQDADLNQSHILNPVEYPDRAGHNDSQGTHCPQSRAPSASLAAPGDATAPLGAAELLRRAAKGNPAAWEEIIRRYSGLIAAKIRTFRLQDADSLDAMQMTWLRLAENIHRIQHPERLGGWLATTASRECMHILRQGKRTQTLTDAMVGSLADPTASPEQHVINAHTAHTLHMLIAELPPRRRQLLQALFSDEPPLYTELSRTTGIPPGSIGPTRNRVLHQLRQMLGDHQLVRPA
jgi:RNA polymerase sigma factor (sigma-70 family)